VSTRRRRDTRAAIAGALDEVAAEQASDLAELRALDQWEQELLDHEAREEVYRREDELDAAMREGDAAEINAFYEDLYFGHMEDWL
jgi:hypothetical protein